MPTQLETIISALEKNGEPMTASQLADTLRVNGTGAARPENTVLSLVHKCRDIVNMGGSHSKYGLREWLKDGTAPWTPGTDSGLWMPSVRNCGATRNSAGPRPTFARSS